MKYFITEAERKIIGGTCYFEFQKGKHRKRFWCEDSILLNMDIFDKLELYKYFSLAVPQFAYYGITEMNEGQWKQLVRIIPKNSMAEEALNELTPWVRSCFSEYDIFTILGI